MNRDQSSKLVEAFAGDSFQASYVKSVLDENKIESFVQNQNMGTIAPWYVSAGGLNPVSIFVLDENFDTARLLIDELKL